MPGKMNMPGGGDTGRHNVHVCDGKAGGTVTFPADLSPNFSAAWKLANLLRTLRKWKVGERRQYAGGLQEDWMDGQVRAAETWDFAKSPAGQLAHTVCTDFAPVFVFSS